jgi:prepilin-type N-terminal cleavage/methylation domain-containing protein
MQRHFPIIEVKGGHPPAEGFSLLEVLVATALLGLALIAVMQVLGAGLRAQETSWSRTRALSEAERVLQQYCLEERLAPGTYQGGLGRHTYRVVITPQMEIANARLPQKLVCYLIQVTVFWKERGRTKSLALETMRTASRARS